MLNKALRIPEPDVLFKLRLFIQHLYEQIENESISNTSLTVYLGQTIHQNDLDDLQKSSTNNGLLVFSQFLSGSTDLLHAIKIAKNLPRLSDEYIPVILHLNISSNLKCANTSSLRYLVDDDNDVLLNMGIMGRLVKAEKENNNENGIASIYLTLIKCENEKNIQRIIETKRKEAKGAAPFVSLIKLMMMMNQQARAEQLVQMIFDDDLLKSDPNLQGSLAASCHILGAACHARGDFKRAVELFHLSLDTFLRFVPADAVQLSPTYNNIGSMYFRQEDYEKAAEYHQKALNVQINSHNPNLSSIASYSNNVGVVQLKQGKYSDAAKSFDRALKILQQINQPNDPDLASTYDNLGDAHLLQDKYDEALTYYSKALEIQRLIEPRNSQALASFNNSIGNVYNKMHRYGDALVHFKRALECQQEYLPATHPSFASLYNNIGSMYYRQEQYADALPCYLKSLEIELMCLPENHPTIAVTHFNIATTYTGLGRFEDAILSTERSIEQLLKTLPPDHPEIIENRSYIETIKRKQMLKGLFDTNGTNF
jgi:tetratricopeptide (TPR) repeat protein